MKINKTKLFGIGLFILMFAGYVIAEDVLTRTNPSDFIEIEITNGDGVTGTYTFPGLEIYCRSYFKGIGDCTQTDLDKYLAEETLEIERKVSPISSEERFAKIEQEILDLKANLAEVKVSVSK